MDRHLHHTILQLASLPKKRFELYCNFRPNRSPPTTYKTALSISILCTAHKFGAAEFVDPRPFLRGTLKQTFKKYPNIGPLLPAMGYGTQQVKDLSLTINATKCDGVVIATPIDLRRIIDIKKPSVRVFYDLQEIGTPNLTGVLEGFVRGLKKGKKK